MSNEKAFQIGQYAAFKGKPSDIPEHIAGIEARRAWRKGYDNEMAGQRLDRGISDEALFAGA